MRSKYERKEWVAGSGVSLSTQIRVMEYTVPLMEEWIVKRGAKVCELLGGYAVVLNDLLFALQRHSWKRRWLVLLGTSCAYYSKKADVEPKGRFSLLKVQEITVAKEV